MTKLPDWSKSRDPLRPIGALIQLPPGVGSGQELRRATRDERPRFLPGELCCEVDGFSLHAKVRIEGSDRDGLERLCRYVTRPPIQLERLSLRPDGRVVYALRRRWRDGTSAIVFEPLDFLARLAALVPRPRAHLLTYHGVLAPAAKWREFIVPRPESSTGSAGRTHAGSHGEQPRPSSESTLPGSARRPKRPTRSTWAELMLRAFAIDVLTCPHCGGLRRLIAFLTDGLVVRRILAHLGLPTAAPPIEPARAPPEFEFA